MDQFSIDESMLNNLLIENQIILNYSLTKGIIILYKYLHTHFLFYYVTL